MLTNPHTPPPKTQDEHHASDYSIIKLLVQSTI